MKTKLVAVIGAVTLAAWQASATIAYQNPAGTYGNQTGGPYNLGMNFTVGAVGVYVTALGAFDNGQNGFAAPVEVAIYRVSDQTLMTPVVTFSGTGWTYTGGSTFQSITPVLLSAGTYQIVAGGYGGTGRELNFNEGYPNSITLATDGGGVLAFGNNYYSTFGTSIGFPTTLDGGPIPRYAAGTFDFTPVPEVSQFAISGVGLLGLVYVGRCAYLRRKGVA